MDITNNNEKKNVRKINNKYILLQKIGSGSFGSIYLGENARTKEKVAIKMESIKDSAKLLKNESTVYQYLQSSREKIVGLPHLRWFGKDDEHYYMVINLLGESLQTIKNSRGVFSLTFTLQVGIQIIQLLKSIHDCGLIHRDIKPDNFLLGLGEKSKQLHIIDFGFCKPFLKEYNPLKKTNALIGSLMYASVCAHMCFEQSRRDDLESLGYMLLYFLMGSLEWQHCQSSVEVLQMKEVFVNSGVAPPILSEYFKIVKQLSFEERPDYNKLIELFSKRIEEEQKKKVTN